MSLKYFLEDLFKRLIQKTYLKEFFKKYYLKISLDKYYQKTYLKEFIKKYLLKNII